jgi:ankyrin repeat protein
MESLQPVTQACAPPQTTIQGDSEKLENMHKWEFKTSADVAKFEKATLLYNSGKQLPELQRSEKEFSEKSNFFNHLALSPVELYIYLKKNPSRVNEQDEKGRTLLHYAALSGHASKNLGPAHAVFVCHLLLNAEKIDFNIKDSSGSTPVHTAGLLGTDKVTCRYVFPEFVKAAIDHGFDCSTKGESGYTILHLAALHTYTISRLPDQVIGNRDKNLSNIMKILIDKKIPNFTSVLDALSDSGATALYYAINRFSLEEAKELLDNGANPEACGWLSDKSPFSRVSELKKTLQEQVDQPNNRNVAAIIQKDLESLIQFESHLGFKIEQRNQESCTVM